MLTKVEIMKKYVNWTKKRFFISKKKEKPPKPVVFCRKSSKTATYLWACANAAGGTAGQEATFTLGADAGGTWKVRTCQHWFDQTNQVEIRVSFNINGTLIDVIDEKSTELTGDKIFYGELIQTFTSGDTLSVNVEFTVGGITPFPSDSGNRPIEISFERVL